jgi:hypothetical protein
VGDDIKSTSKAMRELLGEGEARVNIKEILQNLSTVSADLKALISESKPNITQSLEKSADAIETFDKSVREIAKNLDELILLLKDTVDENRGTLKGNLEELDDLIQRAENTIEKFDDELEKIRKQEGTLGKLVHDASLYQEAEKIVSRVQDIVSPVSSFRWDLGLRTEYFAKSEFFKGTLSLGFWPASDKFLLAQVVSDPWQDKFTLSAQGGFRWGFFAPRAGILESKIGIGLDLYTFKDRVIFSLEGFDFNRDPGPHFRAWTSLVASEYIHFLLGVSDFTLAKNREIYFGLRFGF